MGAELRVIPQLWVTTFGAVKKQHVWKIDATGRPDINAPESTRNRLINDPWFIGVAIPVNPYTYPNLVPEQIIVCHNGRLADIPPCDSGPWNRRNDAFWLLGPDGARPRAETASRLYHRIKGVLPLVGGQWIVDKVNVDMDEPDKFLNLEGRMEESLRLIRSNYGISVTVRQLLDDRFRIPAQNPLSAGIDFTPGAWRALGVVRNRPEDYEHFSAWVDAVAFLVLTGGGSVFV